MILLFYQMSKPSAKRFGNLPRHCYIMVGFESWSKSNICLFFLSEYDNFVWTAINGIIHTRNRYPTLLWCHSFKIK